MSESNDAAQRGMLALDAVLDALERQLKSPEVAKELAARGVNSSLALTAALGLAAYLRGDKVTAIEDFSTVAEEIATRSHNKA
jgi:hypothetical protein